jgi:hypothetical protein
MLRLCTNRICGVTGKVLRIVIMLYFNRFHQRGRNRGQCFAASDPSPRSRPPFLPEKHLYNTDDILD